MQPGRAVFGPTRSASPTASSVSLGISINRYFSDELPQLNTMMRMIVLRLQAIGNPSETRNAHQAVRNGRRAVGAGDQLGDGHRFALAVGLFLVPRPVADGGNVVLVDEQAARGAHAQAGQLPAAGAHFATRSRQRLARAREQ